MWEATVGFKYEKGYGMQDCVYSGNSWERTYDALCDAFEIATGRRIEDVYSIEKNKPCEIIDSCLPKDAPAGAVGMVYAITKRYE